jgi:hypothetical protein
MGDFGAGVEKGRGFGQSPFGQKLGFSPKNADLGKKAGFRKSGHNRA